MPGWPGPLDGGNRSGRFLRRGWGGQHSSGNTGVLLGGPRSAAGRPDRREGKTEEARGRGKKHLTGGTGLAEAVSGCSREGRRAGSGWAVEGKRERGRGVGLRTGPGKWARARPTREKRKEGRGCWALGDLGQGREGERGFD
jgi:hypothetical protein